MTLPSASSLSFSQVEAALLTRWPENKIAPDLGRISALVDFLGNPQTSAPVIHIAGTNGKTTTSRMIEVILRSYGLTTGLFTSPDLNSITERIQINGSPVSEESFVQAYEDIAPFLTMIDQEAESNGGPPVTMFEALTALAFACFADAPVDVMIIECGLGATWDATNVVEPMVSVLTPVGLDHQEYLGKDLASIAREKAGVIKPGIPVAIAEQVDEVALEFAKRCQEVEAPAAIEGIDFAVTSDALAVGGQVVSIRGVAGQYPELFLPLYGKYQGRNAALAVAAVELFLGGEQGRQLDVPLVEDGLTQLVSPGRLERVRTSPTVIVDAAHNPHGMRATCQAVAESFDFPAVIAVLSVLEGKDALGMIQAMSGYVDSLVITRNSSPRSMPANDLYEIAELVFDTENVFLEDSMIEALDRAVELADNVEPSGGGGIVALGSIVTASDVRSLLAPMAPYPPVIDESDDGDDGEELQDGVDQDEMTDDIFESEAGTSEDEELT